MRAKLFGCLILLASGATLLKAQNFTTAPCSGKDGDSDDRSWFFGHQQKACEVRRATLPLVNGQLGVTGKNGGIEVVGEDRNDIALEVKITVSGSSRENAQSILHDIRIVTEGSNIRADGPSQSGSWLHGGWSASYRLRVPRRVAHTELRTTNGGINVSNLDGPVSASSSNGGIDINQVHGDVNVSTTNGGLHLNEVAGAVHAQTTNGGVNISLAGNHWQGGGLYAKSTNGAITLKAPDRFAAHLVADTTNGGISVGFPVTVQGKIGKHLDTDINGGGPTVHLETTNGGVSIDRI